MRMLQDTTTTRLVIILDNTFSTTTIFLHDNIFHLLLRRAHEAWVGEDLVLDNRVDEVEDDQETHEHFRDIVFIQLVRGCQVSAAPQHCKEYQEQE